LPDEVPYSAVLRSAPTERFATNPINVTAMMRVGGRPAKESLLARGGHSATGRAMTLKPTDAKLLKRRARPPPRVEAKLFALPVRIPIVRSWLRRSRPEEGRSRKAIRSCANLNRR
jgi:hypothetical protein